MENRFLKNKVFHSGHQVVVFVLWSLSTGADIFLPCPCANLGQKPFTGIKDITVCGLAKKNEEIYVADLNEPIRLQAGTPGITLLQRIRDEAHRFAISYHRNLRSKRQIKSILDDIDGIGHLKKKLLIDKFGSIDKIKKANKKELAAINGIGEILASKIKRSLNPLK